MINLKLFILLWFVLIIQRQIIQKKTVRNNCLMWTPRNSIYFYDVYSWSSHWFHPYRKVYELHGPFRGKFSCQQQQFNFKQHVVFGLCSCCQLVFISHEHGQSAVHTTDTLPLHYARHVAPPTANLTAAATTTAATATTTTSTSLWIFKLTRVHSCNK